MLLLLTNLPLTDPVIVEISQILDDLKLGYRLYSSKSKAQTAALITHAVQKGGYQAALVHGGDGTVAPALKAAAGSNLPIIILPGGTDNSLARTTGSLSDIGMVLKQYAANDYLIRSLPVATANKKWFMVDVHFGWSEQSLTSTPPKLKRLFGRLAYTLNAIKTKADAEVHDYQLLIDGTEHVMQGYACVIANHGNPLLPGMPLFRRHGQLQIAVLKRRDSAALFKWYVQRRFFGRSDPAVVFVAQGTCITLYKGPRQSIIDEDQSAIRFPFTCQLTDRAANVIVPYPKRRDLRSTWRWLATGYYRNTDQLRRIMTGIPSERFSRISPQLFVGGQYGTEALEEFKQRGITGIVSLRTYVPKPLEEDHGIEILHLPTVDKAAPRLEDLQAGVDFITKKIQQGGSVYVHCRQGEGRGPTMAAAYLMSTGMRLQDAIAHLRYFRPFANPTQAQRRQLLKFQQKLHSKD